MHFPASRPHRLWIKICATTNISDALLAADLGADAVGFVFAPSPRQVTAKQVAAIAPRLPHDVEKVGVFTGSSLDDLDSIAQAAETSGLTAIQLHGGINLPFATALQDRLGKDFSLIHTVHWDLAVDQQRSAGSVSAMLSSLAATGWWRVLIDAKVGAKSGGMGLAFDWSIARRAFHSQSSLKLIVAGGLRPENVADAVAQLNPYGVDVASGVEQTPGKKDPEKLKAFMQKAREAK